MLNHMEVFHTYVLESNPYITSPRMAQVLAESVTSVQQSSLSFAFPHPGRPTLDRIVRNKLQVKVVNSIRLGP